MTGPAPNREPVVGQLAEVWSSLREVCRGLRPPEWDLPTECPGWTVRDNLSHLVGIERMLLGEPAPDPLPAYPEHVQNPLGEINEAWVERGRGKPGTEVLLEFGDVADRRLRELRAVSVDHFDVVSHSLLGRMTYREFLRIRVIDSWVHEQDIRRAAGRPGGRNGAGESVVVEGCAANMARVVARMASPPDGTVVAFTVSGLLGRQLVVSVAGGRGTFVEPDGLDPTTTLSMDQEAFWRLCFGRVEPVRLLGTGQVQVDGDVAVGHTVLESMAFVR